jgi:hypothetical protein
MNVSSQISHLCTFIFRFEWRVDVSSQNAHNFASEHSVVDGNLQGARVKRQQEEEELGMKREEPPARTFGNENSRSATTAGQQMLASRRGTLTQHHARVT